jgi:UDP-N-acetylmuramyl pentapeptide synthase
MRTHSPEETRAFGRRLAEQLLPGDVLLFKGSRGMRMELILEGFLKDE